jgi:hypothetical protein
MTNVTYRDGIATITTRTSTTEVHVSAAAHQVRLGEIAATSFDTLALAAGYEALERERDALREELAAARAGTIGKEHGKVMQDARGMIAELRTMAAEFMDVYDSGNAPDGTTDEGLRDAIAKAEHWLICDSTAATARAKVLKGSAP